MQIVQVEATHPPFRQYSHKQGKKQLTHAHGSAHKPGGCNRPCNHSLRGCVSVSMTCYVLPFVHVWRCSKNIQVQTCETRRDSIPKTSPQHEGIRRRAFAVVIMAQPCAEGLFAGGGSNWIRVPGIYVPQHEDSHHMNTPHLRSCSLCSVELCFRAPDTHCSLSPR